ncbi:5-oxoprolinase subunit B family protein [Actinacidiphila paucisporea]|uniref:Sensor histidine kinase inhibitor, KipI family n=1 Tax=Actinacidiphila paucisporea TaxID=310782 RepID=A0A1M7B912_9ACTN|nr:allophanate hydrolase subunit 1 [Actinacidiphila paucisporea]SHL51437.1 sensor histidine kinase inhibitor, KipI family [Actinacidiphila paucisporea]
MKCRVLAMGRGAVLVETEDGERAQALHAELLRRREAGEFSEVREIVPAARSVLVAGLTDPRAFAAAVSGWDVPPVEAGRAELREVAVRFDGPDVAEVAALWSVRPDELPGIVTATPFRVAFCGFAPGFAYLTGLPAARHVPRRPTPRTVVPAGSLGLAGPYAGLYPRSSPGGWQLIGTTDAPLWEPGREPAALLSPGTEVRFVLADR